MPSHVKSSAAREGGRPLRRISSRCVALAVVAFVVLTTASGVTAQPPDRAADLARFQRDRVGLMFVWGPFSLYGQTETVQELKRIPNRTYDRVLARWNPHA